MRKRICNMCGKDFDMWDEQENFSIYREIGYGSEFDEQKLELDLCCSCFDKLMKKHILPKCKVSPLTEN